MPLPPLNATGDLPFGVHRCPVALVLERFGTGSVRRQNIGSRLQRVLTLLHGNDHVVRVLVFGSFVTAKVDPNDVDIFLVMDDAFDLSTVHGEARLLFEHGAAQSHFGASIFWVRRSTCYPTEDEMVAGWGSKRDGTHRGIVEIEKDAS